MSATAREDECGEGGEAAWGLVVALLVPLTLLAVEVVGVTLAVEPVAGVLSYPALPRLATLLVFAFVVYVFLSAGELVEQARRDPGEGGSPGLWLVVHLALAAGFIAAVLELTDRPLGRVTAGLALLGLGVLGVGLAAAAFLTTMTPAFLRGAFQTTWRRGLAALGLGVIFGVGGLALLTLWPRVCGPSVGITARVIDTTLGGAVRLTSDDGYPVIGTSEVLLKVMPGCSELDALLGYALLMGVVAWMHRRRLRPVAFVVCLAAGLVLLYVLNAVRIYGLVLAGLYDRPEAATWLAHSRLSALGLIVLEAAMVLLGSRWFVRREGR